MSMVDRSEGDAPGGLRPRLVGEAWGASMDKVNHECNV